MRSIVFGSAGQDGHYLVEQLAAKGHIVFGVDRSGLISPDGQWLQACDLESASDVAYAIKQTNPDRVFYLAAYHHSSQQMQADAPSIIHKSFAVHVTGLLNVLDALVASRPKSRLFYAASSRVFGAPDVSPQNEETPLNPRCPYGISKAAGVQLIKLYRLQGLHCCSGYLYNHESERRSDHFVSAKIIKAVVAIERGQIEPLVLGDLEAQVDWGYAPEYTDAMARILDLNEATDFIIGSGRLNTIKDFATAAFEYAGLKWQDHVRVDPSIVRSSGATVPMVGDASKLEKMTGWKAKRTMQDIARHLMDAERRKNQ